MTSEEIFPNPLVKRVIFAIRFPNLFFLEDRIGEFQVGVMKQFPKSELLLRRPLILTNENDIETLDRLVSDLKDREGVDRIWKFESESGVTLNVTSSSLALVSEHHKSYRLGEERFRDVIDKVTKHLFAVTQVPIVKRIGLRYIDECPILKNESDYFRKSYNTVFCLDRFPLESAASMDYKVEVDRGPHKLRYVESLQGSANDRRLILDFDAWSEDIEPEATLEVTDALHEIIWQEFRDTIRDPVLEYMRRPLEDAHVSH